MDDISKMLVEEIRLLRNDISVLHKRLSKLETKVISLGAVAGALASYLKSKFFPGG